MEDGFSRWMDLSKKRQNVRKKVKLKTLNSCKKTLLPFSTNQATNWPTRRRKEVRESGVWVGVVCLSGIFVLLFSWLLFLIALQFFFVHSCLSPQHREKETIYLHNSHDYRTSTDLETCGRTFQYLVGGGCRIHANLGSRCTGPHESQIPIVRRQR